MSKHPKRLDVTDFWNDCLKVKEPSSSNFSINNHINDSYNYNPKAKRNKRLYKYDTNPSFQNNKIIQKALISEENTKAENTKLINESIDYMISLYNKAKISQERKKKNIKLNKEKELTLEKEICSFKPKQYKNISLQKKLKKTFGNLNIYERGLEFQQKKMAKLAKIFEENKNKKNVVYSFHPDISNKNLNKVFYSKNYCKSQADNDSNKIFLSRLMKAREEEQYKKNCLLNNNRIEYYGNNKRLKKSLSQKDSLVYKNNLHNSILSLRCFPSKYDINNNSNNKDEEFFLI